MIIYTFVLSIVAILLVCSSALDASTDPGLALDIVVGASTLLETAHASSADGNVRTLQGAVEHWMTGTCVSKMAQH